MSKSFRLALAESRAWYGVIIGHPTPAEIREWERAWKKLGDYRRSVIEKKKLLPKPRPSKTLLG